VRHIWRLCELIHLYTGLGESFDLIAAHERTQIQFPEFALASTAELPARMWPQLNSDIGTPEEIPSTNLAFAPAQTRYHLYDGISFSPASLWLISLAAASSGDHQSTVAP